MKMRIFVGLFLICGSANSFDTVESPDRAPNKIACQILDKTCDILEVVESTEEELCSKFAQTWTILASISCDADITGVFTALDECCDDLTEAIIDTRTLIFDEVCDKFGQTWTILAEIDEDLEECCNRLDEQICDKFNETWTILDAINGDSGSACDIVQPISAPTTIMQPGSYCLTEDINGSIIISADQVILDLNKKSLIGAGVGVNISGREDVEVKNGFMKNNGGFGVSVSDSQNIKIFDIDFEVLGSRGVNVGTSTCVQIYDSVFRNHVGDAIKFDGSFNSVILNNKFFSNSQGIFIDNGSENITIKNNKVENSTQDGIRVFRSSSCLVKRNESSNNGTDGICLLMTSSCIVFENINYENALDGIRLSSSLYSLVCDNIISTNGQDGIEVDATSPNSLVLGNKATLNVRYGISDASGASRFNNNIASRNAGGLGNYNGVASGTNPVLLPNLPTVTGFNLSS